MTIQLPPLKSPSGTGPHAVPPEDALSSAGGLRHTALGRGDRAPRTTSANDGYHRAAPPRNLGIRTGQRPTIHRLHQCRGPKGPRASVTTARGRRASKLVQPHGCGGRPPPFLRQWPTRDQRANSRRETACLAGKKKEPRRAVSGLVAGIPPSGGSSRPSPSHILSDPRWTPRWRASVRRSRVGCQGAHFVWGGPCVCRFCHTKWAAQVRPLPGPEGTFGLVRRGASCWLGPPWAALKAWGGRPPLGLEGRGRGLGGPRSAPALRRPPSLPSLPSLLSLLSLLVGSVGSVSGLGALLGRLRTGHRVGIYIEWVLLREPHHLPRQPTEVDPGLLCARDIHIYIQGTQPARSLAPSWSGLWRAGPGDPRFDSTPANRTAPHRTVLHASQGGRGPGEAPRTRPPLAGSLPSAAPPICPSFAANWRMLRAYWDRLPERLRPSPLARGGPPRGGSVPSEPTPHGETDFSGSPRLPPAPPGPCRVARCQAIPSRRRFAAPPSIGSTSTHHAPVEVKQAHVPAQSPPAMPCHRPHRPSRTTPTRTHRPSLASDRARKRSAAPTRFPGARPRTQSGPPPASRPSPPLPSHAANWRGPGVDRPPGSSGPGRSLGAPRPWDHDAPGHSRSGSGHPSPAKSSVPLQYCQLAKGRAHWNRTPWHPGPPSHPQRPRATSGSSGQLAAGLGRRETALEHRWCPRPLSLGVGPPPSARRCRGTLMGRCVLHKSSQGSG